MLQVPLEISDDGVNVKEGVVGDEPRRARLDSQLVDVNRNIADRLPEAIPGIQQPPGLRRRPRAKLDDVHGRQLLHEPGRQRLEQRRLRPRQVILGHSGDVLEQPGSDHVVEVLRWQSLRARREPATRVVFEPLAPVGVVRIRVRAITHGHWSAGHRFVSSIARMSSSTLTGLVKCRSKPARVALSSSSVVP